LLGGLEVKCEGGEKGGQDLVRKRRTTSLSLVGVLVKKGAKKIHFNNLGEHGHKLERSKTRNMDTLMEKAGPGVLFCVKVRAEKHQKKPKIERTNGKGEKQQRLPTNNKKQPKNEQDLFASQGGKASEFSSQEKKAVGALLGGCWWGLPGDK